jgi:adenylate cyclase
VGLGVAALLWALRGRDWVERVEEQLLDVRTRTYTGTRPPDERIVVAQIEDSDVHYALGAFGQRWPWPLDLDAGLLDVLHDAGARALMLDELHLDHGAGPDELPPGSKPSAVEVAIRDNEATAADAYAKALSDVGRVAAAFQLDDAPVWDVPVRRKPAAARFGDVAGEVPAGALVRSGAELPILRVIRSAARLGFANTPADLDGTVRRAPTLGRLRGRTVVSLPLATAALAEDAPVGVGDGVLSLGTARQRLMHDASFLVNFRADSARSPYARVAPGQLLDWAATKLEGKPLPPEARRRLAGKVVVLGINLAGQKDLVPTPFGMMDGPVYQAAVLDNLLHGDGRVRAPAGTNALLLLGVCLLVGVLAAAAGGRWLPHLLPVAVAGGVVLLAFRLFAGGTALDLFTPLLGVLGAWLGVSVLRLLTEGRRNRWLEATFGRYMAPALIEALKRDPSLLALGGREQHISVLFSDVAGFTTISAGLQPQQVVGLLNRYLTGHAGAVMDAGGVVDKFEGDAVMAFFGDPVEQPDHPERACRAALAAVAGLPALEPVWRDLGLEDFRIRVGVNTGRAVVGNMGSDQRFDYTCLGDDVNVASRLEGAAKAFGVTILVGGATAEAVRSSMLLRDLGRVRVVGREEPVPVFELVAERASAPPELVDHVEAFEAALDAVRRDDLQHAADALEAAERLHPGSPAVTWLRALRDELASGARPRPWDGVTVLTAK